MTEYKKGSDVDIIKESAIRYGIERYRGYTVEDYYALPEDTRAELIDGVLYDMASPSVRHQDIAMQVSFQMADYVNKKGGKCKVLQGPVDVQLDRDDKTMVVPDIIIVCDPEKVKEDRVTGGPDFVAEIVSPSSRKLDYAIKSGKYCGADVREYWVVDPEKDRVIVYDFEGDKPPAIYSMKEEVPVQIFGGELKIRFPEFCP